MKVRRVGKAEMMGIVDWNRVPVESWKRRITYFMKVNLKRARGDVVRFYTHGAIHKKNTSRLEKCV